MGCSQNTHWNVEEELVYFSLSIGAKYKTHVIIMNVFYG